MNVLYIQTFNERDRHRQKSGKTCCSCELSFKIAYFSVLVWCYPLNTIENGGYR